MPFQNTTIVETLKQCTQELSKVSPTARLDAEVLLRYASNLTPTQLITCPGQALTPLQSRKLFSFIQRRSKGEPIAYITGEKEFWSMALAVSPDTLVPRPETELLVEQTLCLIPANAGATVADLGTGCGAIALALALERPECHITATDISYAALAQARKNAGRQGINNVLFLQGDWFAPLKGQRFQYIVSNPPYVSTCDPHLSANDISFEPEIALVAGIDGLQALRHIIKHAAQYLETNGWLLLEHGYNQAKDVSRLLRQNGFSDIRSAQDLGGNTRITLGRLASAQ